MPNEAFNIAKNLNYDRYQRGLASMVYRCFDEKTSSTRARSETLAKRNKFASSGIKNENISNNELSEELIKQLLENLRKWITITFYRQYLGCRFSIYAIKK